MGQLWNSSSCKQGYKLYKSDDGGATWGDPDTDRLFDADGAVAGWKPYAQFHLPSEKDSLHCIFSNEFHGYVVQ